MRVAIYARYSSDRQSDASIDDQIRLCHRRIEREGWVPGEIYTDHALSGATALRPGYQRMLEDARAGRFDVLLADSGREEAIASIEATRVTTCRSIVRIEVLRAKQRQQEHPQEVVQQEVEQQEVLHQAELVQQQEL